MNKEASFDFYLPKVWVQQIRLTKYENSLIFISFLQEFFKQSLRDILPLEIGNCILFEYEKLVNHNY